MNELLKCDNKLEVMWWYMGNSKGVRIRGNEIRGQQKKGECERAPLVWRES